MLQKAMMVYGPSGLHMQILPRRIIGYIQLLAAHKCHDIQIICSSWNYCSSEKSDPSV